MIQQLRSFLYLDPIGIKSLNTQIHEFSETKRVTKKQTDKSTGRKGRLSLNVFAGILGGKGEAEMSHNHGKAIFTERTMVKENEQKLIEVENKLTEIDEIVGINNIKLLAKISAKRLPVFIKGSLPFTLPAFSRSSDLVEQVIKSQAVTFELDQSCLTEDYSLWPHILMGGSLSKFESARDVGDGTFTLGCTSHLAVLLRGLIISAGTLGVFGLLHKTGENLYIKPYAIWR